MLKELIKFANELDEKGLRKEADYLDRLMKRFAEEEDIPQPPDARDFVVKRINDKSTGGGMYSNPLNLFRWKYCTMTVIGDRGILQDNAKLCVYENVGTGDKAEREAELESMFPGITTQDGHMVNDPEYKRVYKLRCQGSGCSILELTYDTLG